MAARRLLIIMLVLLGISTLAAALVDTRSLREDGTGSTIASETESTTTEAETLPAQTGPAGEELKFNLRVGGEKIKVVRAEVGDQVALLVRTVKPDLVEIPALGLVEAASPQVPGRFDILATEPGEYGIRLVDGKRVVARLEFREPEPDASEAATEPAK